MNIRFRKILFLCSVLFFSIAAATPGTGTGEWPGPETIPLNMVVLSASEFENLNIETTAATEQPFAETVLALGHIQVRPGYSAVVSSRVPGRAVSVSAMPDHEVKQGEPLVVVESLQPGNPPPRVTLEAPISGVVSEISVVPGEPVTLDRALIKIMNIESVYGIARVPEHLASRLREGLPSVMRVPGWPKEEWDLRVEHMGVVADPISGTLEAAYIIPNDKKRLRPGMRAEFSIEIGRREQVLAVPREAVQAEGTARFVFTAHPSIPRAFTKVPVEIGAVNDRLIEIKRGLAPGSRVVTEGAYALAFAGEGGTSLKEALDAAHGHEHNPDGSEIAGTQHHDDDHHAHDDDHVSPLAILSLIGNAVLLGLLFLASKRRNESATEPANRTNQLEPTKHA